MVWGALTISFIFRVGFCRWSKITEETTSNRFHAGSSSAKLDKLPGDNGTRFPAYFAVP